MFVAANSSPLICLLAADALFVPRAALRRNSNRRSGLSRNCRKLGAGRAGSDEITRGRWIRQHKLANPERSAEIMMAAKLDRGESAALALEIKTDLLLIDEFPARRLCGKPESSRNGKSRRSPARQSAPLSSGNQTNRRKNVRFRDEGSSETACPGSRSSRGNNR